MSEIPRKDLNNNEFLNLRQSTEKISGILDSRLKEHLNILRALFQPKKLFGSYMKSSIVEEVPGEEKAFSEFQKQYTAICERPFELPKKIPTPLPPISNKLQVVPYQYPLMLSGPKEKPTSIKSPTRWILSYQCETSIVRLRDMILGSETKQPEEMKLSIYSHLSMVVFLQNFSHIVQLLRDLRYETDIIELPYLGGMPVVVLKSPVPTFLPSNDFIIQITQLSGVPAFQEIIDIEQIQHVYDPFIGELQAALN